MFKAVFMIVSLWIGVVSANPPPSLDMSRWMEHLADTIQDRSLTELFLPGSHDSATYKLEHKFGKNQDITSKLNTLRYALLGFGVTKVVQTWSQAQNRSIIQQLEDGVRYLDLRIIYRDSKKQFYTVHGLYGPSLKDVLSQINQFLHHHPQEIIVIQVGDLRYMPHGDNDHHALIAKFKEAFGNRLISKSDGLALPIKTLWGHEKQVVLIYKKDDIAAAYNEIFPRKSLDDYWANADNVSTLKIKLDAHLKGRQFNPHQLYVIQSQMTPATNTITASLKPFSKGYKSLHQMAAAVQKEFPQWLNEWHAYGPAIVLVDFINKDIARQIVQLNMLQQPARIA
ncbi:MAG: phosphatidylinositol-specific phospholipase C domain-containing protein [Candidatus Paracaedibacteraceae bacterium]|nr:phosphatidylinositol-specific phospholipase C domain-containing protein [Candidatus Paracaedibacteraceae bacterium]